VLVAADEADIWELENLSAGIDLARETNSVGDGAYVKPLGILRMEEFAVEKRIARVVNFGELEEYVARETNRAMLNTFKDFPELRGQLEFFGSMQEFVKMANARGYPFSNREYSDYAYTFAPPGRKEIWGIGFNEAYGKKGRLEKFREDISADVKAQLHSPGTDSVKGAIDHEIAHLINSILNAQEDSEIKALFGKANASKQAMKSSLAEAATDDIKEFISEGWAEYRNQKNPRNLASKIGERLKALWEKKF
jgi:hypothetical protein